MVESHGSETAIWYEERDINYRESWSLIQRFSAALTDRGIESGDRVAVYLPNVPQSVAGFHGILHTGGVVVPMNPQYKAREIEFTDELPRTTTGKVQKFELRGDDEQ